MKSRELMYTRTELERHTVMLRDKATQVRVCVCGIMYCCYLDVDIVITNREVASSTTVCTNG
jgi:hypothetical protein